MGECGPENSSNCKGSKGTVDKQLRMSLPWPILWHKRLNASLGYPNVGVVSRGREGIGQ